MLLLFNFIVCCCCHHTDHTRESGYRKETVKHRVTAATTSHVWALSGRSKNRNPFYLGAAFFRQTYTRLGFDTFVGENVNDQFRDADQLVGSDELAEILARPVNDSVSSISYGESQLRLQRTSYARSFIGKLEKPLRFHLRYCR